MSLPEHASRLPAHIRIPRGDDGATFPAPWTARAFALAVSLNERGLFAWSEWAELLGAELGRSGEAHPSDPEAYWRAWLRALETMMHRKGLGSSGEIGALQDAWRQAAAATPHGEPIELRAEAQA